MLLKIIILHNMNIFMCNGKCSIFFKHAGIATFNINLVLELDISVTVPSIIKWKFLQRYVTDVTVTVIKMCTFEIM